MLIVVDVPVSSTDLHICSLPSSAFLLALQTEEMCFVYTASRFFFFFFFLCEGSHVVYDGRRQFVTWFRSPLCSNTQAEEEIFVILLCLLLSHTERPQMPPLSIDLPFK